MRVKDLKDTQYRHELEISELGKMISERSDLINLLTSMHHRDINDDNQEVIDAFSDKLLTAITQQKNINNLLVNELIDEWGNCNTIKFVLIRIMFEKYILKRLVKQYEDCIQNCINIDEELATLEK
jgi:fructose-1,6-bisphosphatase